MCGRFFVPEDDSIQMIRAIVEYLEHRNVKAKTGDVFPGDIAAVVASNRHFAFCGGQRPLVRYPTAAVRS